jgi:lipoic acid synthetase
MIEEKVLIQKFVAKKKKERLPKPDWLRIRLGDPTNQNKVLSLIEGLNLHTVCQEARCPNIFECWTDKTATFMLGGDTCTRHCGFCAVNKGKPMDLDPLEPRHVAEAVAHLDLEHAVITSVNRDDLPDGGAAHWAETIRTVHEMNPSCRVEVLIPRFSRQRRRAQYGFSGASRSLESQHGNHRPTLSPRPSQTRFISKL